MSITSSKLSGWSEIGFAFGMAPPSAALAAHSWDHTSCWHASKLACSAFCYHVGKYIRILAVIVPVAELRQVQRQVVFAHLVECTDYATLQQAPEAVQIGGMDVPAHVFASHMAYRFMRIADFAQSSIAAMLISCHQGHVFAHRLPHKALQGIRVDLLNNLGCDVALASNRANHGYLAMWAVSAIPLASDRHMLILPLPADVGFVYLNLSHELAKSTVFHGRSDAMAHVPGSAVRPATNDALDLKGANTLLAGQHQIHDLKPGLERIVRILKDRLGNHGKAIAITTAAALALTDPVKRTALDCKHLGVIAARACHAIRPTALLQECLAGIFLNRFIKPLSVCVFIVWPP
jgi:hypothetical protein